MSPAYTPVYEKTDQARNAYLLKEGALVFVLSSQDYFTVKGHNIIFGAGEVLKSMESGAYGIRELKVYAKDGAVIQPIPADNLSRYISLYNVGFNITKFIADCVRKSNQILSLLNDELITGNNGSRRFYKLYYNLISRIKAKAMMEEHARVQNFVKEKEKTSAYRKGLLFSNAPARDIAVESKRIDEYTTEYPAGAVICRQDERAENLFVLNRGVIRVLLNNKEINEIDAPGTIFGEMSLFLNEPRSATLISRESSIVTSISRQNLKAVAESMPDFFKRISITLWEHFAHNISTINEYRQLNEDKARLDLKILEEEIFNLYKDEQRSWLLDYKDEIRHAL